MAGFFIFLLSTIAPLFALSITTYNVRNFDSDERTVQQKDKLELEALIKESNSKIFVFQEVVMAKKFSNFFKRAMKSHNLVLTDCCGRGGQKIGIAYNRDILKMETFYEEMEFSLAKGCVSGYRPAALAYFKKRSDNKKFVVVGLHLKAGGDERALSVRAKQYQMLKKLVEKLRENGKKNIIIAGDLNTTEYILHNESSLMFKGVVEDLNLFDSADHSLCTCYWNPNSRKDIHTASILDHIMVTQEMVSEGSELNISVKAHCERMNCQDSTKEELGKSYKDVSDHCPVRLDLKGF